MNYETLKLFLHLSRTLHFGKTSQECYLSPSTLSRIIKRLEEEVGYPLFIRNNRQVILTPKGLQFRQYASETLAQWENFQALLNDGAETLQGQISFYCSVTACYSIIPETLNQFRQTYPDIHIKLEIGNSTNALKKIKEGSVDIIIAALPDSLPEDLESRIITVTPLVFVAPTARCPVRIQIEKEPIHWAEIPMILPQSGLARSYVNKWCHQQNFSPEIYSEVVGNEAILALVSAGCGIGVVPQLVIEKSPLQAEVRVLNMDSGLPEFKVGICLQKKKLRSPLIRAYWTSLQF